MPERRIPQVRHHNEPADTTSSESDMAQELDQLRQKVDSQQHAIDALKEQNIKLSKNYQDLSQLLISTKKSPRDNVLSVTTSACFINHETLKLCY